MVCYEQGGGSTTIYFQDIASTHLLTLFKAFSLTEPNFDWIPERMLCLVTSQLCQLQTLFFINGLADIPEVKTKTISHQCDVAFITVLSGRYNRKRF